jgi:DNA-binding MarR family transcriptional regulator
MRTIASAKKMARRLHEALRQIGRVVPLRDPLGPGGALDDLTAPQAHVVMALGHEALPMAELSCRIGSTGSTVTGIVDRLEALGLVERRRETHDRRVVHLHLTDKGEKLCAELETYVRDRLRGFLELLDTADQKALTEIVERLSERVTRRAKNTGPCAGLAPKKAGVIRD